MKNKYKVVKHPIKEISTEMIEFQIEPNRTVFLKRIHDGMEIWKLTEKGIEVLEVFVEAYNL